MAHESRELPGVVHVEEDVVVVGGEHVAAATDFVETLGPSQDAHDDLVARPAGPKEETAVQGPSPNLLRATSEALDHPGAVTLPKS
jgi:hypothetical protein